MSSQHTSRTRRLLAFAAAAAALAATLTACAPPAGGPNGFDGAPPELRIAMQAGPGTLDPALINQAAQWYVDLAYSPLIQAASDGTLRPGLATDWGYVGEGNTTFRLTLREGVTFADGSDLTAEGVKKHLEYVKGAGGQMSGVLATLESIDTPDDLTVELTFSEGNPELPRYFSQSGVGIADVISPTGLENADDLGTMTAGAGPYVLDAQATIANDTYVYVPNENYWDEENVHWSKVTIKVIPNLSSTLNAMKSGQIDFTTGDYTTASEAEKAGLQVHFVPNVFSGLNLLDRDGALVPALGDQRVRQAINYAIDREAIVDALYGEWGSATTQTTHGVGYVESLDDAYPYDPEKAKQLLAEAGYADGFTLPVVSAPFFNGDTMVQAIAGQLREVGITIQADSKADVNEYVTKMASGEYPAAWIGFGTLPMFVEYQQLYGPTALFNAFKSTDAELTSLSEQLAVAETDQVKELSEQIETRLVDLAWYAPVAWAPLGQYATDAIDPEAVASTTGENPIVAIVDLEPAS
ncbi:ABC transporter substrate-binding protein [Microbacterium hydrocarbonoxydans]|uniref:ABC transporter substrate-binding protein n=1 Tax=Microbacterium hydrocarbonoxydans TaxID=273678 RepID=UPI00203BA834|nr:ABC transporter substrate-binding protein [Microbacterium hydrocarbonoxydans]MCM3778416.1 ABC transporter substrate-binding protein [Microbacterium hydrocarbonoxydans]